MNNYLPYGAQQPVGAAYSFGMQPQSMPMYAQNTKQAQFTNPLGNQKIKELLEKGTGAPKLTITEADVNQALCTHRFNGQMMFYDLNDGKGTVKCKICGEEFIPTDDADIKDVEAATQNLLNILNTAKIAWLDVPDKTATEFFQVMAIIKKTPELFNIAMNNFSQYNNYQLPNMSGPVNGFNALNQILAPQMPMMQQPYTMQPQQQYQPYQGYQQPQYDAMGYPVNNFAAQQMQAGAPGVGNPFMYGNAQVPVQTQDQVSQQQPQQAAQGQAPANSGEKVTKQLHV